MLVYTVRKKPNKTKLQTGKTHRSDVRETGLSRHHLGPIESAPEIPPAPCNDLRDFKEACDIRGPSIGPPLCPETLIPRATPPLTGFVVSSLGETGRQFIRPIKASRNLRWEPLQNERVFRLLGSCEHSLRTSLKPLEHLGDIVSGGHIVYVKVYKLS